MALLGAMALILSTFMVRHALSGAGLMGCNAGSSCDTVLGSRWSSLFGILPVSALALGVYLAVLVCLAFLRDRQLAPLVWKILLVLAGAISGSAVWFFILQKWMLGAWCKYCMAAHATGLVFSGIVLWRFFRERRERGGGWIFALGIALAAALACLQLLTTPKYAYHAGSSQQGLPVIGTHEAPLLGDPDAEHVLDLMFDYQCSHCRKVHAMARELTERYPSDIAFVLCPTPLSYACNPYVPADGQDRFAGSCDLARFALAVWKSRPELFESYDQWLFTPEDTSKGWYPRQVESAREKAAALIGEAILEENLQDPSINSLLAKAFELFGRTTVRGNGGIPRLVSGSHWVIPEADDTESFAEILRKEFGIDLH